MHVCIRMSECVKNMDDSLPLTVTYAEGSDWPIVNMEALPRVCVQRLLLRVKRNKIANKLTNVYKEDFSA